MAGFVPLDSDAWPAIAESIHRPWPKEACAFDLRWHKDREDFACKPMPSRAFFRGRWGWSDWAVRALRKDEDSWTDKRKRPPADLQRSSKVPPADLHSERCETRAHAGNPPASLQSPSSSPPDSLHTRVGSHTPTHTHPQEEMSAEATDRLFAGPDPWEQARQQWQAHSPTDRTQLWTKSKGNGKLLAKLAKMKPDDLAIVLRWLRESPGAELGRAPKGTWATDIATVARHRDRYLDNARTWEANGAPRAAAGEAYAEEAGRAWSVVLKALSRKGMICAAEPFSVDADREAAIRAALRIVPLREISVANDFEASRLRKLFAEAYAESRGNP